MAGEPMNFWPMDAFGEGIERGAKLNVPSRNVVFGISIQRHHFKPKSAILAGKRGQFLEDNFPLDSLPSKEYFLLIRLHLFSIIHQPNLQPSWACNEEGFVEGAFMKTPWG